MDIVTMKSIHDPVSPSTDLNAELCPGRYIKIWGKRDREFALRFDVGNEAVYGSYNLIYTGRITSIGAKTITIDASGTGDRAKRLNVLQFIRQNHDYDKARIEQYNAEERQCI